MNISFESKLSTVRSHTIIRVPLNISKMLPSRGMVMIQGSINGLPFQAPLEPDGKGSHWFEISDSLKVNINKARNQVLSLMIEPMDEWPEPEIPNDIIEAITKSGLTDQWQATSTKAKWSWLRWIRSTKNPTTRQKRIHVACSKLEKGDKRPCCFNQTICTITDISKTGVLLD